MTSPAAPSQVRPTLAQVADLSQLTAAWEDVLASDLHDGILGTGVTHFKEDAEQHLVQIAAQVGAGTYLPGLLTPVSMLRPDGHMRMLHVPAVRDRIVERSILAAVTPVIDPWLGPFSYAYRPGLGVADAVQAVARLRDEGLRWAARADFHDCFGNVPVSLLRRMLDVLIEDTGLRALIDALLARAAAAHGAAAVVTGLPQGGLCSAEHKPPYAQCWLMRSASPS